MCANSCRRAGYHIAVGLLFVLVFGICANKVFAQNAPAPTPLVIKQGVDDYNLVPYLYVTRAAHESFTAQDLYNRHLKGLRGDVRNGSVLVVGAKPAPVWVIFSVQNRSWNDKWVLSFGKQMDGRMGVMQELLLINSRSERYIDLGGHEKNPYISPQSASKTVYDVTIPKGQEIYFLMKVVPHPGVPVTLPLRLMSKDMYQGARQNFFAPYTMINLLFVAAASIFFAAFFFKQYVTALSFITYFVMQGLLFHYNNDRIFTDQAWNSIMTSLLMAGTILTALLMAKMFLRINRAQATQKMILIAAGFIASVFVLLSLYVVPDGSFLQMILFLFPGIAVQFFLALLSMAQAYNGRPGSYAFALGWLSLALGSLISFFGMTGLFPASSLLIAAGFYSLFPQAMFFVIALALHFYQEDHDLKMESIKAQQERESISFLKQNKEAAENQRLRRLIEHERQAMNELREREVQQHEQMRQAKEDADEANRAKSAFLAVVSHEIRTPMSGIMGMVRFLLDTSLSKQQHDYAQTIQDSGEAMLSLLNDILDFEKIENGKMDLERLDFDLPRLINGIGTLMSGHAASKNIYLRTNIDPRIPRYVMGDPVRIRQVLLNLAGNSIKFTKEGGVTLNVTLEPSQNTLTYVHRIRFSVDDTGIGITKEAQKNLFNPFAQADSTIARKFGGTGLGLAISQRLIEAMGGRILINSTEGHGSSFYFTLLMEQGSAENVGKELADTLSPARQENALNVLIVEDNEINQRLMSEIMTRMGHKITLAGSGEEALERVADRKFDLVLMDMQLPGISGAGATRAIRALPDRQRAAMPVIALTGNVSSDDINKCYAANMNGHLPKPVDPKRLKIMIDKVVRGELDNPVVLEEEAAEAYKPILKIDMPEIIDALEVESEATDSSHVSPLTKAIQQASSISQEDPAGEGRQAQPLHFDEMALASLRKSMKPEDLRGLIDGLFEKADETALFLSHAIETSTIQDIIARAHELKGMAGNFGLVHVRDLAGEAERKARMGDTNDLGALLAQFPEAVQDAKAVMRAWIES